MGPGCGHTDVDFSSTDGHDRPGDLAVVEEHAMSHGQRVQRLGKRAPDARRCRFTAGMRRRRCPVSGHARLGHRRRCLVGGEGEDVPYSEHEGLLERGQQADRCSMPAGVDELGTGLHVRGVPRFHLHAVFGPARGEEAPVVATRVPQPHHVPGLHPVQPLPSYGDARAHGVSRPGPRLLGGDQAGVGGMRRPAPRIAPGVQGEDPGAGLDRPGPELGPGQVHEDGTRLPELPRGLADVVDHLLPTALVVVGTVDPGTSHPPSHELAHDGGVVGRLRRHRDQDPRRPSPSARPEQGVRVCLERVTATPEAHRRLGPRLVALPGEEVQHAQNALHRVDDVLLGPPQRGEPELGEGELHGTDVVAAQDEIVDQVGGSVPVRGVDPGQIVGARHVLSAHLGVQDLERTDELGDTEERPRRSAFRLARRACGHCCIVATASTPTPGPKVPVAVDAGTARADSHLGLWSLPARGLGWLNGSHGERWSRRDHGSRRHRPLGGRCHWSSRPPPPAPARTGPSAGADPRRGASRRTPGRPGRGPWRHGSRLRLTVATTAEVRMPPRSSCG